MNNNNEYVILVNKADITAMQISGIDICPDTKI